MNHAVMTHVAARLSFVHKGLDSIFAEDLHAKRVGSLAGATLGVMLSGSLAVATIGQALAQARGRFPEHGVKQVDRLLSNQGIVVWDLFADWVPALVGERKAIVVAMGWTDFDADDQTTLMLSLVTTQAFVAMIWGAPHRWCGRRS